MSAGIMRAAHQQPFTELQLVFRKLKQSPIPSVSLMKNSTARPGKPGSTARCVSSNSSFAPQRDVRTSRMALLVKQIKIAITLLLVHIHDLDDVHTLKGQHNRRLYFQTNNLDEGVLLVSHLLKDLQSYLLYDVTKHSYDNRPSPRCDLLLASKIL